MHIAIESIILPLTTYACLCHHPGWGEVAPLPAETIVVSEGSLWILFIVAYPEALQRNNYTECDECH
jgi:hypothetical protein